MSRPSAAIAADDARYAPALWSAGLDEEDSGDQEADDHDRGAGLFLPDRAGEAGAGVAARDRAGDHDQGGGPVHGAAQDEVAGRDAVDAHPEEILDPVGGVDVGEAQEAQDRQHQDPDPGAEVAAVDPHA